MALDKKILEKSINVLIFWEEVLWLLLFCFCNCTEIHILSSVNGIYLLVFSWASSFFFLQNSRKLLFHLHDFFLWQTHSLNEIFYNVRIHWESVHHNLSNHQNLQLIIPILFPVWLAWASLYCNQGK